MVRLRTLLIFFISFIAVFFAYAAASKTVQAVRYDLVAPTGTLQRGGDVQFTINIDTGSQSITAATIGMTYKADVLQYVSSTPGNTFPTVSTQTLEGGKLIFTASSPSGFSGTGTFATVTFKIIATASGSTELCVLFNPETPTSPPAQPQPTALPKTGSVNERNRGMVFGIFLLVIAAGALISINHKPYRQPPHKTLH